MYDLEEIQGGAEHVTSLPYDVISAGEMERLKKANEYNVTHLTLPAPAPGKPEETKYREANKLLKRWRKEGILYQRPNPAFYLYEVTYHDGEKNRTARGLGCLIGLDPEYDDVRPHERTHEGPIEDRLELLKATAMDLEPIQFLYRDPEGSVMGAVEKVTKDHQAQPMMDFTDPHGTHHALWSITDPDTVETITNWFGSQRAYIADGHHRYATALHYAKWRRDQNSSEEQPKRYEHKLAVLMEAEDPGLSVHPTHRLVQLDDAADARKQLAARFRVKRLDVDSDPQTRAGTILDYLRQAGDGEHRFVFDWGAAGCDGVSVPDHEVPPEMAPDRSEAWRRLDVSVLHHHVLPATLGITQENAGDRLRYTRDPQEAVAASLSGEADCTVLMNATPQRAVLEVADAREHMPQKSTYFLPKLQSGLFFSPL